MNGRTNSTSTGEEVIQIPLDPCTNLSIITGNAQATLTWTDPLNKYATPEGEVAQDPQQLAATFAYTRVVRKVSSQPTNPHDGDLVTDSAVRNQYQSTGYVDTGLTNGTTYYYALYAYNTDDVYSEPTYSVAITPIEFRSTLAENAWTEIDSACSKGIASSIWEIGDVKTFTALSQTFTAIILDFDHDNLADKSGKASISFGLKEVLSQRTSGFQYPTSYARSYLLDTVFPTIEPELSAVIVPVIKINKYTTYDDPNTRFHSLNSTSDAIFMFGVSEVGFTRFDDPNLDGTLYPYYSIQSNRAKGKQWATRLGYYSNPTSNYIWHVYEDGSTGGYNTSAYITFGFCVGKYTGG